MGTYDNFLNRDLVRGHGSNSGRALYRIYFILAPKIY